MRGDHEQTFYESLPKLEVSGVVNIYYRVENRESLLDVIDLVNIFIDYEYLGVNEERRIHVSFSREKEGLIITSTTIRKKIEVDVDDKVIVRKEEITIHVVAIKL